MSYAMAEGLQTALYERLAGDAALVAMVSGAIYDAVPGVAPELFVALGQERVRGRGDSSGRVALHDVEISVVSQAQGYAGAKRAAARISDLLTDADLPLPRGRLVGMSLLRARARRDEGEGTRRIDLTFRARLDDPAA
ncbi:DUF3168 domain-containing protein [Jannaschia ovalis]|uniref:DUF3168 domain-containing protein n=1 Tax=Jannaschia ovalis TaxID=3038773 RepID=A0ABY8LDW2_9RHOB|nr:DUF3168 domain-containing protein [Jannaschia sp. GRR-S6-38]WGH78358.1 DUF3168 domain-containing protein [Jannaschia sp. GRR-S6-38]